MIIEDHLDVAKKILRGWSGWSAHVGYGEKSDDSIRAWWFERLRTHGIVRANLDGKLLLIYVCDFHVLNHLLLIYICKLHWNLNTMFVCQVISF